MTPRKALEHEWIVGGLPDEIKNFHLFREKDEAKSKQLKENKPKAKLTQKNSEKPSRQPLQSASNTRENKSVPSKELRSKPTTARKESHFCSIYREKSVSV